MTIQETYQLPRREYEFVQAVTRHPHLGAHVAALVTCIFNRSIQSMDGQLARGQEPLLKQLAADHKVELKAVR